MIASLRGTVQRKEEGLLVLEVGGVGYEIHMTATALASLPDKADEVLVQIEESMGMYGGGTTLYGFLTPSEKTMFRTFKDHIPSTGAKKALEYLEKACKSLPDFRRAILEQDGRLLTGVFGFTKKTADRLIDALKDKIEGVPLSGSERLARPSADAVPQSALSQAMSALSSLGYKPSEAKAALAAVAEETGGKALEAEQILRMALKRL